MIVFKRMKYIFYRTAISHTISLYITLGGILSTIKKIQMKLLFDELKIRNIKLQLLLMSQGFKMYVRSYNPNVVT